MKQERASLLTQTWHSKQSGEWINMLGLHSWVNKVEGRVCYFICMVSTVYLSYETEDIVILVVTYW